MILAGGSGTRLWPLSRMSYPKSSLGLASGESMLRETVRRASDPDRFAAPVLVCGVAHRFLVAETLRTLGVAPRAIVLEPVGRGTAPAVACAALTLAAEETTMLVLPSDHAVGDAAAFGRAVRTAARAAADGALVMFGIRPTGAATGYGYIRRGRPFGTRQGCFSVDAFIEKPDQEAAAEYAAHGAYDWNSGMFVFTVGTYLRELERLHPRTAARCRRAVDEAERDMDFVRLAAAPFGALEERSVDRAVMEHTDRAAVVPASFGWSDLGSWSSLWDIGAKDASGNVLAGDVVALDTSGSYIRGEGRLVAALGVEDLVIVADEDAVLVLPRRRAEEGGRVVNALRAAGRVEAIRHKLVRRTWGSCRTVHEDDRIQVKRITVNAGAALSPREHRNRAEYWVVVRGTAEVQRGDEIITLGESETIHIPPGTVHRVANRGEAPLAAIGVRCGDDFGEDDILRLDDGHGRA